MDITQHLRVIRRWHRVLVASAILGTVLAGLFLVKVSPSGVEFRRPEKWESTSTLLVTQRGFPWGRTTLPGTDGSDAPAATAPAAAAKPGEAGTSFANPDRLSLAGDHLLLHLAEQRDRPGRDAPAARRRGQRAGALEPEQRLAPALQAHDGGSDRPRRRQARTGSAPARSIKYLSDQQDANRVPAGQRVEISILNRPVAARIASHGAMLGAAILFLALAAGMAACYLLESLRLSRAGEQEPATVVEPQARLRRARASR